MEKEQIVKALECCTKGRCVKCPQFKRVPCQIPLMENALSLIREQEKRIEELENICESYALQYGTATDKEVFLKKERADTVRKMVERLKMCFGTYVLGYKIPLTETLKIIDQIAKEILEDHT